MPNHLMKKSDQIGEKLIHISTDCVFSGKKDNIAKTMNPMEQAYMQGQRHWEK
jgi:dTDP-4-dehydrorhamnose reductase